VSTPAAPGRLKPLLGPADAAALVVSNVIGVGIFTTPGIVAKMVPHPWAILGLWLAGGLLALAGAGAYAELAALHPHAGGEYVYLREGFGPLAGFLTGWTSFVAGFSGAIAAGAVGLASYLSRFWPPAGDTHALLRVPFYVGALEISPQALTAALVILLLSAVHLRGLGAGRLVQNSLAAASVLALLALIGLGFAVGHRAPAAAPSVAAPLSIPACLLAMIPVMFTYSGWNAAAYVAEEVREPGRNLPRALALGTAIVTVLYLLLNLLYLYALPLEKLAGKVNSGEAAAEALFGIRGGAGIAVLLVVALGGGISAMVIAGPRVYFAMGRDRVFPASAGSLSRFHTPAAAIAAQAAWSILLVFTGSFEQILIYTGFAVVLFSAVAVVALFVLRRRHPDAPRPFRTWGYPVAPALFVLAGLAMMVSAIQRQPKPAAAGLLVMAAGLPVYWWSRRRP
jgi:basic amino acid/polyamine antiporter, APA family